MRSMYTVHVLPYTQKGEVFIASLFQPKLRLPACTGRVPALSGVCLGKTIDFPQTRGAVPIADRQSVHCVPVIVRALGRIKAEGTHKERSETRNALALERYHSAATETSSAHR